MAELFVINLDADLDGQYLSDLPIVNATPVARQIGFYMGTALTATSSQVANISTYIATGTYSSDAGAGKLLNSDDLDEAGAFNTSVVAANEIFAAGDLAAANTVSVADVVAKMISVMAIEIANGERTGALNATTITAEFEAVFGNAVLASGETLLAAPLLDITAGGAELSGALRILMGAEPSGAGTFSEGAILGNHRLIGGLRRIYSRDRIDACIHEGSLSFFKSATDFEGTAKDVQCLILNESGVKQ